jgi:hypothetical protein
MATKTTPISVRITHRDAEFIAELNIEDAITPSDKIRALLKEARNARKSKKDRSTCLGLARKTVDPLLHRVKEREMSEQVHSELITSFGEWLMEMLGYITSQESKESSEFDLIEIEREFANRIFRLCNMVVRMGITQKAQCYDQEIISNSLPPLMEIMTIIQERKSQGVGQ